MNTNQANPLRIILGVDLRAWRTTRDWTQRDLANRLGVRNETVCRWETGVVAPSIQHLAELVALIANREAA